MTPTDIAHQVVTTLVKNALIKILDTKTHQPIPIESEKMIELCSSIGNDVFDNVVKHINVHRPL